MLDWDHPVQFPDGRVRDRTGRILSRAVSYFPIQSHFSHPKADISADSKLKGRSPDVPERKFSVTCTILSRFVPPGPRRSAGRATAVRGKCRIKGVFSHWNHRTIVRTHYMAWQAASVTSYSYAKAWGSGPTYLDRRGNGRYFTFFHCLPMYECPWPR